METQVYQAILERRTAPIIPRLKEILSKPDSAPGMTRANCAFGLAGHRRLPAIMPVRTKVGRKPGMNWNLSLKNNPKIISSLEISR